MFEIFRYSDSVYVQCPYPEELDRGEQKFAIQSELEDAKHFTEDVDGFRGGVNNISHKYDVTLKVIEEDG